MGMNCGIVGLPIVGKSTIFSALTSAPAEAVGAAGRISARARRGRARGRGPGRAERGARGAVKVRRRRC